MESLWQDIRHGARLLFGRPAFTAIAVVTLALGIGANTAVFSVINAVLLRPLPYPDAHRIMQMWETYWPENANTGVVSPLNFRDWRAESESFELMAAYQYAEFTLTGGGEPALLVSQVALAMVLLVGAGLLVRSFIHLQRVNPGFDPENVLTMPLGLPAAKYKEMHRHEAFFRRVLEEIESIPGVVSVGAVSDLPFSDSRSRSTFEIEGRPNPPGESFVADSRETSAGYFRAMGIRLVEGRQFTEEEDSKSPGVVIINQAMAERFWPGESAIGKRIVVGGRRERELYGTPPWRQVVGIVNNIKHTRLSAVPLPEMYVPFAQRPSAYMTIVVRGENDPTGLIQPIRGVVHKIDSDQAVPGLRMMWERLSLSISTERLNTLLLAIFAGIAVLIAAVGLYGVMSYMVAQRTHEIGIRMALGASSTDVLRLVVGQGMMLVLTGVTAGLVAAFVLTRFLESLLFGVSPTDPLTFAGITMLLMFVALFACYIPARSATRVDPAVALRGE